MTIDAEVRRELDALKQGAIFAASTFTANVSSTTTVVTKRGVSSGSIINITAVNSNASNSDIVRVIAAKDSFTVTHNSSSVAARTYGYAYFTPIR